MAKFDPNTTNSTTIGTGDKQHTVYIKTETTPEKPSLLALDAVADTTGVRTTYYLWVDTDGVLHCSSTIPTNQDVDAYKVGDQE